MFCVESEPWLSYLSGTWLFRCSRCSYSTPREQTWRSVQYTHRSLHISLKRTCRFVVSVCHNYSVCPMILLLVLVCKWIWFPFVGGNDCRSETVHCRAACPGWTKVSTGLLTLIKKLLTANSCYKIQKLPIQDCISHKTFTVKCIQINFLSRLHVFQS